MGKPGFPVPLPGGRVWEGVALPGSMFIPSVCGGAAWRANVNIRPRRGAWGKPGYPPPPPPRGRGKPGFPHTPAPQGNGETRFPHSPTRGRFWEGYALPGTILCSSRRCAARAAWTADTDEEVHQRVRCQGFAACPRAESAPQPAPGSRKMRGGRLQGIRDAHAYRLNVDPIRTF